MEKENKISPIEVIRMFNKQGRSLSWVAYQTDVSKSTISRIYSEQSKKLHDRTFQAIVDFYKKTQKTMGDKSEAV